MPETTRRPLPIKKKCKVCGTEFYLKLSAPLKTIYCSRKCARHAQHFNRLEENRERNRKWYQKNREKEVAKNREYRQQNRELFNWYHNKSRFNGMKDLVLQRDNNQCVLCGDLKLSIHHIDGNNFESKMPNNNIDNLITLCQSCHHKLHWWQRKNHNLISIEDIVRTMAKVIEANSKS